MKETVICPKCNSIAYDGGSDYEAYVCFDCGWELPWDLYYEAHKERQEYP